jgi:hypothetical protein
MARPHLQPNSTVDCIFNGGFCRIKHANGGLLKSSASGTVLVNYLYDRDDKWVPLKLAADQEWSANAIKAIKQEGSDIGASNLIIGIQQ